METSLILLLFVAIGLIFILGRLIIKQDEENEHLKSVEHIFNIIENYKNLERELLKKDNISGQEDIKYEGE